MNKLECCLEEAHCVGTSIVGTIIILFLYVDDIVLMVRCPFDIYKELKIHKDL